MTKQVVTIEPAIDIDVADGGLDRVSASEFSSDDGSRFVLIGHFMLAFGATGMGHSGSVP